MSKLVSFLLAYTGATAFAYIFLFNAPFPELYDFFYLFLGRQVALMRVPYFWIVFALIYFTLRSQWIFMKKIN